MRSYFDIDDFKHLFLWLISGHFYFFKQKNENGVSYHVIL